MQPRSSSFRPPASVHATAVRLLHTSDIHIGSGLRSARDGAWPETPIADLHRLSCLARRLQTDGMLITGDFFDHARIDKKLAAITASLLEQIAIPVVVLPGNHDPFMADCIYTRHRWPSNVHVMRHAAGELLVPETLGVQIWGQAHTGYDDFAPLAACPAWIDEPEAPLWRVAVVHGLYVRSAYEAHLSYRFDDDQLKGLQAHYVGAGHLENHERIGDAEVCAYYSGAPDRIQGATLIDLRPAGVTVRYAEF